MSEVKAECFLCLRNKDGDKQNVKIGNVYYESNQLLHPIITQNGQEDFDSYDIVPSLVDLLIDSINEKFFDISSAKELLELFDRQDLNDCKTKFIVTSAKE